MVFIGEEFRQAHWLFVFEDSCCSLGFGMGFFWGISSSGTTGGCFGGGGIGRCRCFCFSSFMDLSRSRTDSSRWSRRWSSRCPFVFYYKTKQNYPFQLIIFLQTWFSLWFVPIDWSIEYKTKTMIRKKARNNKREKRRGIIYNKEIWLNIFLFLTRTCLPCSSRNQNSNPQKKGIVFLLSIFHTSNSVIQQKKKNIWQWDKWRIKNIFINDIFEILMREKKKEYTHIEIYIWYTPKNFVMSVNIELHV